MIRALFYFRSPSPSSPCSSPVDMQSYELCSDIIDVVIDVSCIYGTGDDGAASAYDEKSGSIIKLSNNTVLYLREVNKYVWGFYLPWRRTRLLGTPFPVCGGRQSPLLPFLNCLFFLHTGILRWCACYGRRTLRSTASLTTTFTFSARPFKR